MTKTLCAFAALALLAGAVAGQSCSTLTITGSLNPGQTLTIAVTGAGANDPTLIAASQNTGSTTFNLGPFGSLVIDLAQPLVILPMGVTDANGDVSLSFVIPNASGGPSVPSQTLQCQAVSIAVDLPTTPGGGGGGFPFPSPLSFCKSNVAQLQIGS